MNKGITCIICEGLKKKKKKKRRKKKKMMMMMKNKNVLCCFWVETPARVNPRWKNFVWTV